MPSFELGESIPPDTAHAVSVSLPSWKSNVGYEEGEEWVVSKMTTGYPRFFIHKAISRFADDIVADHGQEGQQAMLFPTAKVGRRCMEFVQAIVPDAEVDVIDFGLAADKRDKRWLSGSLASLSPTISAVLCRKEHFYAAKQYWQHTGDGTSSRRAEFCHELYKKDLLLPLSRHLARGPRPSQAKPLKGPRRYHRPSSIDGPLPTPTSPNVTHAQRAALRDGDESRECTRFLEERFGRNLDLSLSLRAKSAIRRRIAGAVVSDADGPTPDVDRHLDPTDTHSTSSSLETNSRGISNLGEDDVYLFPCGMNAIFNVHQTLLSALGPFKSINFGFPYVDTLKILQKFGPGCAFYGHASAADLDHLEGRLSGGERFLALFCEFPGNPLLTCPDLDRIRRLADRFGFAVVVDETIGTFANINVLQFADVVVSSLTKIFSGDCNVMGGCAILNPNRHHYRVIKAALEQGFQDTYWPEDAVFMERNSRDFQSRIDRSNANSEAICAVLKAHPRVKDIYYPKYNPSRPLYEMCKRPRGGYGGLLSLTFHSQQDAVAFYDALDTAKGPSLGTNFTLTCPYVLLAHYQELDWAARFGAGANLIRVSVGLEDTESLRQIFRTALAAIEGTHSSR